MKEFLGREEECQKRGKPFMSVMDQLPGSTGGQPLPPPPPPLPTPPPQLPPQNAAAVPQIMPPPADDSTAVVATGMQPAETEKITGDVSMGDES